MSTAVQTPSRRRSVDRPQHYRTESSNSTTTAQSPSYQAQRTSSRSHAQRPSYSERTSNMDTSMDGTTPRAHDTSATVKERRTNTTRPSGKSRTSIPAKTGVWQLGKTIGAGSMGKVKLAKQAETGEQVAVKIVPRNIPADENPSQSRADRERAERSKEVRTAREAAIVSLLDHPYICGMRDVVRTNFHWYMLFEYVNGGQMLDYIISHGRLKEKQARKFSRQIASALDYCHRNSIVHRDLKIENILISKTGDIKIIDFGLSNLFAPKSHLSTFCGSLYFAAPELLQAKPYTGPEVDIWSYGIVLYVLVCGKVPFDDQSMPALHTKIKKGLVDYPNWLTSECKNLLSRMLVTEPSQRATLHEIMNHPWMVKGYAVPPENHLPIREPLSLPLDPNIIDMMTGFDFGSPETISAQLHQILASEDYTNAVKSAAKDRESAQPRDGEKKRGFGFGDFYKRRNSANSRDNLSASSTDVLQHGLDPVNAFHPLISVYYLCLEKAERDRSMEHPGATSIQRSTGEAPLQMSVPAPQMAVPVEPKAAYTNASRYEMPGEHATGGRSRPRARTHGEDEIADNVKNVKIVSPITSPPAVAHESTYPMPPEPRAQELKKESTATNLFRKFSTRSKRKEPEKTSRAPTVTVHEPQTEPDPITPVKPGMSLRKSFSVRRTRDPSREPSDNERKPSIFRSASRSRRDSDNPRELLSPPRTADNVRTKGLGRSTSVNSADFRRRQQDDEPMPLASRPKINAMASEESRRSFEGREPNELVNHKVRRQQSEADASSRMATMRAKSMGHARKESMQARRAKREHAREEVVQEEPDIEADDDEGDFTGPDSESIDKDRTAENAKPVQLKGLFSVSTTSTKSVQVIRLDIIRVLHLLNIDYTEMRGGFQCRHTPSIDFLRMQEQGTTPSPMPTPTHRRKISFFSSADRERDEFREAELQAQAMSQNQSQAVVREHSGYRDRSVSNSDVSDESVDGPSNQRQGTFRRPAGETSTHVQNDNSSANMVLHFEIFVVKIPLLSLHGVQFKRLVGGTWQYKNMADQILKELRL